MNNLLLFSCYVMSDSLQHHGLSRLFLPYLHCLPEFAQTYVPWVVINGSPSNRLIPFSSSPQSFPVSGSFPVSQLFASKYQSFIISPSNDYSGLISFSIDWFDFLAVQGAVKSLLQHHSLKTLVLWCTAFFMVHLSHLYLTIGKILALNVWTFIESDVSVFLYAV